MDRSAKAAGRTVLLVGLAISACGLSACGGKSAPRHPSRVVTSSRRVTTNAAEVLSLSALGTFEGSCPRGGRSWMLRFLVPAEGATDTVSYRVGSEVRHTVNVNPGDSVAIKLTPNAARTHEPVDRFVPPSGQGRGQAGPASVPTTLPLAAVIYQGTEPQILRADVRLALASIGGESGQCVLVGSTVHAYSYPNS